MSARTVALHALTIYFDGNEETAAKVLENFTTEVLSSKPDQHREGAMPTGDNERRERYAEAMGHCLTEGYDEPRQFADAAMAVADEEIVQAVRAANEATRLSESAKQTYINDLRATIERVRVAVEHGRYDLSGLARIVREALERDES